MTRRIVVTTLKVAIVCLIVGLLLSAFGIDPWRFYDHIGAVAGESVAAAGRFLDWTWRYIAIGAVVVVPLWFALFLLRGGWRR